MLEKVTNWAIGALLVLLVGGAVGMACTAPGGGPNWVVIERELLLAEGTLDRAKISFPSKVDTLDDLEAAREKALKAVRLIQVGDPGSALDYLEDALALVQPYLEDEDLRFAAFALQEAIIRVKVNIPED